MKVQAPTRGLSACRVWRIDKEGSGFVPQIFRDHVKGVFMQEFDLVSGGIDCSNPSCKCLGIPPRTNSDIIFTVLHQACSRCQNTSPLNAIAQNCLKG